MSVKSKIQALITAANAKTGEADATLTDAVQTLVDGYGQGGGTSYVDVTLTQDYTSGNAIVSAIQTATGFDNLYAELISPVPESGPCVFVAIKITAPNGSTSYLYRRNSSGTWGWAGTGTQSAYAGDIFRVWEVG